MIDIEAGWLIFIDQSLVWTLKNTDISGIVQKFMILFDILHFQSEIKFQKYRKSPNKCKIYHKDKAVSGK